jgi:6-pyruvoyltetrahydropterin/6-carboxytetrahydropterin synthase
VFRVTRRYQFAASHRLHSPQLSEEENLRVYGKCAYPYGHGHNYRVDVTALGPADPLSGRAADPGALDRLVAAQVLEPFEHRNLNVEVESFARVVPTSENIGIEICRRLKRHWRTAFSGDWPKLEKIRIEETPRNIFEIRADEIE